MREACLRVCAHLQQRVDKDDLLQQRGNGADRVPQNRREIGESLALLGQLEQTGRGFARMERNERQRNDGDPEASG